LWFIDKRQTLMKKSGAEAKIGTEMIKGERPFDLAKVQEIYAAFAEDAKQMPTLFPDCSKTGHKTTVASGDLAKNGRLQSSNRQVRRRHQSGAGQYQGLRWFEDVNSSIRSVWIRPRISCIAERCWAQANLSAKSPTPAALATTLILHENSAIGLATHQGHTPQQMAAPAIEQCASRC
jgi:Cytochrome C'